MFEPKTKYAKIAFDAILFYVSTGQVRKTSEDNIPADLKLNIACIVSVYDVNDNLIRSYGNVYPQTRSLYNEIIENAIGVASKGEKFDDIKSSQLNQIRVVVDVLSVPQQVVEFSELKPQKHGLCVQDTSGNVTFIMPNIKSILTIEQQLERLKIKAGISEKNYSKLDLWFFKLTRYD